MFCVECGKDEPIFRNGVCLSCYLKHTQFSKGPTIMDIAFCPRCSSYKHKNIWVQESFNDILKRHIKDAFSISPELKNVTIQTRCDEQDRIFQCMVFISGCLEGQQITEQYPLTVRIRRNTCDVCSREAGGYYEAIIQIRTEQRTFSKEELKTLRSAVETMVGQLQKSGKRGLFITDDDENRQGLDFFLSEKATAFSIAKKIQEQFGGEFKQSASTAGMKDSKEVFRMTYLVRIPAYRKDDFFSWDNSFFLIVSLHENKVRAIELSTWAEKVIDGKYIQPSKIFGGKERIKEMIFVSQSKKEIQLMDPKTYSTVEIPKPKIISIDTPMVKTVKLDDSLFLVPG
ncbi:MAG TPA: NMD3-related protein [Candidatus Thermoplasmatota archaeon]|nr:NMD3-related protein [Candidatus Thermoplasmatota archaeon]